MRISSRPHHRRLRPVRIPFDPRPGALRRELRAHERFAKKWKPFGDVMASQLLSARCAEISERERAAASMQIREGWHRTV